MKIKYIKQNLHSSIIYPYVLYLEADENYTILHFKNGQTYVSGYTLKVFQEILHELPVFKRINRSQLVNMEYVLKVKLEKLQVTLHNGKNLKISRRRIGLFNSQDLLEVN